MGIPAQQAAKITRPPMPSAAPAVLLHSLHTQQGVCNIVIAMTRRDFGKPAFSLRKKRFVKTHALSLLGTTRLLSRSERRQSKLDLSGFKNLTGLNAANNEKLALDNEHGISLHSYKLALTVS